MNPDEITDTVLQSQLAAARRIADSPNYARAHVNEAVTLFGALAITGQGRDALEILEGSPGAEWLEPLVVALRLYLGDRVNAPIEVVEVGKDVLNILTGALRRIEEGATP